MKRLILGMVVLAMATTACKRNLDKGFTPRSTFAGPYDDTITLDPVINTDLALSANNLYILDGKVFVTGNHTLEIEEGTRIEAVARPNEPTLTSALIITRGSTITAFGTEDNPIVFTSNSPCPTSGDWGGIVLLGSAPLNRADTTIEGISQPSVPPGVDINYGGGGACLGNVNDNSGVLSYVRIEYAGASIAPDNELNGLTCGGVGAGTQLDHIEVAYGNDDAFEFFGGTVNASYLIALVPDDDAFDFDFGYTGSVQFAVSVLKPGNDVFGVAINYSANPNGIESDNNATGDCITCKRTQPIISNMTVIGFEDATQAATVPTAGLLNGAFFRRASSQIVKNSVFIGFPTGVNFSSACSIADAGNFQYNTVHGFNVSDAGAAIDGTNTEITGATANGSSVNLIDPFDACSPDFRPNVGSPLLDPANVNYSGLSSFIVPKTYRGAFANADGVGNEDASWASKSWVKYDYKRYCVNCD